ncbi:MAG: hypothetical protein ACYDBQ_01065 [Thermoplasmatota archaeon]
MAYPPVIPPLTPKEGRQFMKRVQDFELNKEQKAFWSSPKKTTAAKGKA